MKNIGLIVNGDGTKGAFEIGAWKSLKETGQSPQYVVGSAAGIINAALIAQNEVETAESFWQQLGINPILRLNAMMTQKYQKEWNDAGFYAFRLAFTYDLFSGGMNITPLRNMLISFMDETAIRQSEIELLLITVDPATLKPVRLSIHDIPVGRLINYILVGIALPVFQQLESDSQNYRENGFFESAPIECLCEKEVDMIMAFNPMPARFRHQLRRGGIEYRAIVCSEYLEARNTYTKEDIAYQSILGYLDGMKAIGRFCGKKYYINLSAPHDVFRQFCRFVGHPFSDQPSFRHNVAVLLDLSPHFSRKEVIDAVQNRIKKTIFAQTASHPLALLEMVGQMIGTERLQVYGSDAFIQTLLDDLESVIRGNIDASFHISEKQLRQHFDCQKGFEAVSRQDFLFMFSLMLNPECSPSDETLIAFRDYATPETVLAMAALFYLYMMIKTL